MFQNDNLRRQSMQKINRLIQVDLCSERVINSHLVYSFTYKPNSRNSVLRDLPKRLLIVEFLAKQLLSHPPVT